VLSFNANQSARSRIILVEPELQQYIQLPVTMDLAPNLMFIT
jgi:hypothetical protein